MITKLIHIIHERIGCSLGTVFNVDTLQCDDPENVPGW